MLTSILFLFYRITFLSLKKTWVPEVSQVPQVPEVPRSADPQFRKTYQKFPRGELIYESTLMQKGLIE